MENHIAYTNFLIDLHERGIEEDIKQIYPRVDFQLCTIHASRNFESHVWVSDRIEEDADLKGIFLSESKDEAIRKFDEFKDKWSSKYSKPVYNMEKNLGSILKYYKYAVPIRRSIHSTNIIERMNKEIRRSIKIIDSPPSEESAMKIIYLRAAELNE